MGWETVVAAVFQAGNRVVINSAGLFVYNGAPTLGNLLFSISNANGTDQYGNHYFRAATLYLGNAAINMDIASGTPQLSFPTGATSEQTPASTFTQISNTGLANEQIIQFFVGPASTGDDYRTIMEFLSSPHNAANTASGNIGVYQGNTQLARPLAWDANTGNWQNMSPLLNGWAVGSNGGCRYRRNALNEVELQGSLNSSGASNLNFFQLPAGYRPLQPGLFQMNDLTANGVYSGTCDTSGNLNVNGPPAAIQMMFQGFFALS